MHLHRLTLQALGPFVGCHTIDFAELGASGLFLLEGPTGAGKSTLIDAVVFALYGKVAASGASDDRLRSAHARPDDETYVDLVLETGSGIYRVRRTPAYERPKQRGSGTTTQQSSVKLWRLTSPDAPGELLTTRIDEAGAELQRAVGLDRSQFVQTVVLPQGDFASFLRADPESRRGLLQRVFGTEVYEQLQQRLERMRAEAGRAVDAAGRAAAGAVARFVGAAGLGEDHPIRAAEPGDALDLARQVVAELEHGAATSTSEAGAVAARAEERRVELERRRRMVGLMARRDRLRAELGGLRAQAESRASDTERRNRALLAEQLWPRVVAAEQADAGLVAARAALDRVRGEVEADLRALVDAGEPDVQAALAAEHRVCTEARGALRRALELESGLAARRELHVTAQREHETLRAQRDEARVAADRWPAERERLLAELAGARGVASAAPAAELTHRDLAERLDRAREAVGLAEREEPARKRVAELAESATAATARLAAAHHARIAGMAGELAVSLVDGQPCVVCGATEHPAPASPPSTAGAGADPEAAEAERRAAEDALSAAATDLELVRARREQCEQAARGDVDALVALLDDAAGAVEQARAAQVRAAELDEAVARVDSALREGEARVAALDADLAARAARLESSEHQLAADVAEVLAAADGAVSVVDRARELDARLADVERWARALRVTEEAAAHSARAVAERDAALADRGLDVAQVRAGRLDPAELDALSDRLDAHAAALARVTGALAEPELAELGDLDEVDVDVPSAQAAATAAIAQARSAEALAAAASQRAADAAGVLGAVDEAVVELAGAVADAAPVTRMANVAAASGGEGSLTLATYVLGRRFEDLVAAANARLGPMSDGRYALERSTEREDVRTRRTGLAMKVLDHHTGSSRDPRTLSGGETFYVSLCLALGLADVVTAEAGGIDLGTLFIDEGFGSLDDATLDVVLAELSRLRDGGRVVGVVSHVESLKSAIPERVEVRRRPGGGSTLTGFGRDAHGSGVTLTVRV